MRWDGQAPSWSSQQSVGKKCNCNNSERTVDQGWKFLQFQRHARKDAVIESYACRYIGIGSKSNERKSRRVKLASKEWIRVWRASVLEG